MLPVSPNAQKAESRKNLPEVERETHVRGGAWIFEGYWGMIWTWNSSG
jgi:hypothetical protein